MKVVGVLLLIAAFYGFMSLLVCATVLLAAPANADYPSWLWWWFGTSYAAVVIGGGFGAAILDA